MKFKELPIGAVFTMTGKAVTQYKKTDATSYQALHISHSATNVWGDTPVVWKGNRFDDALEIQAGASNVLAIANALVRACHENSNEKGRTTYEDDAAIRLMIHQLAWLALQTDGISTEAYLHMKAMCHERSIKHKEEKTITDDRVKRLEGTITLLDGSTSSFSISSYGWTQWEAERGRLVRSVDIVNALLSGLQDADLLESEE